MSHSLAPPPDDIGDEPQADKQGNNIDSYDECIHIQIISHQVFSLTAQDTTALKTHPSGFKILSNFSLIIIDPDHIKLLARLDQAGRETPCAGE